MKKTLSLSILFLLFFNHQSFSQNIGINGTGANAHSSALLDIDATATPSLGILIPRISLQATNLAAPVTSPATSLLVFNTATASSGITTVSPGYYYWDGTKWVRFQYASSGTSSLDWSLTGNAGTIAGTNFLGTTDNQDVVFKRNNIQSGLINVSLGATSFGVNSLNPLQTGVSNSAFGAEVLVNNTSGYFNTGIGTSALYSNTIGFFNTALGDNALTYNTIGNNNTALGANASLGNISGNNNISLGSYSTQKSQPL